MPKVTDPLISQFVDLIQTAANAADEQVTSAVNSGPLADTGAPELKVLMDLMLPMIMHVAQEILFPAVKPERLRCRIRLRKVRAMFAPGVCGEGGFSMPPEEEQPGEAKLIPSLPKIPGLLPNEPPVETSPTPGTLERGHWAPASVAAVVEQQIWGGLSSEPPVVVQPSIL